MKSLKYTLAASAVSLALAVPMAQAAIGDFYKTTFQGATFTFTQVDADTLTFNLAGNALTGDWSTAAYLGAFDFKNLGLDFGTVTGIANGPGAVNLAGLNTQMSAANVDCTAAGSPPGSICFDIAPDLPLTNPFNWTYTIDFSAPLNIGSTGPHLQLAFTEVQGGAKVGTLYSQDIGLSSNSSTSSTSSSTVPEPASGALAILALGILGAGFASRRRQQNKA